MNERRRRLLRTGGVLLIAGIAGCTGTDGGDAESPTGGAGTANVTGDGTATDGGTAAGETDTPSETPTDAGGATGTATDPVTVAIDNDGTSAWEVTDDESGNVAPSGVKNPTMSFRIGNRYVVENGGYLSHPFAFRAADGETVLSQSGDGTFEDDPGVDWVDDDEQFAFTVTEDLAVALDSYACTIHASMQGDVEAGYGPGDG